MDVLTFGESMVLFTPQPAGSIEGASTFLKHVAGAESNFSIGLARLGHQVSYVSRFGDDGFARYIVKTLRGEGVDVSRVVTDDTRPTAVFFKETSPVSGTNVLYYRALSAASALSDDDLDLKRFPGVKMLHVTGITPALSAQNRSVVLSVLRQAKALGIAVSFDPNMRFKLWHESEAVATLREMATYASVALPGIDEGWLLSGYDSPEQIADWFIHQGCQLVVVKLGADGAYYRKSREFRMKTSADGSDKEMEDESGYISGFPVTLVDEVGAGDAFAAGLVSGLLDGLDTGEAVSRACALGAIAVCGVGDYELAPSRQELTAFLESQEAKTTGAGRSSGVRR